MTTPNKPQPVTPKPILSPQTINLITPTHTPNNHTSSVHLSRYHTVPVHSPPPYSDTVDNSQRLSDARVRLSTNSRSRLFAVQNVFTPTSPSAPIDDTVLSTTKQLFSNNATTSKPVTPAKPSTASTYIELQQQYIDALEQCTQQRNEIDVLRQSNNKLQQHNDELQVLIGTAQRSEKKLTIELNTVQQQNTELKQYIHELRAKLRANKITVPYSAIYNNDIKSPTSTSAVLSPTHVKQELNDSVTLIESNLSNTHLSANKQKWTSPQHQQTVAVLQQQNAINLVESDTDELSEAKHSIGSTDEYVASDNESADTSPNKHHRVVTPVHTPNITTPTTNVSKRTLNHNDLFNKSDTDLAYLNIYSTPQTDTLESELNQLHNHKQLIERIFERMLAKSIQYSKSYQEQQNPTIFSNIKQSSKKQSSHTNTGKGLELFCGMLFTAIGYTAVMNGQTADEGVDIRLYKQYNECVSVIQCKQYTERSVTKSELDEFCDYTVPRHNTKRIESSYFINSCPDTTVKPFPVASEAYYARQGVILVDRKNLLSMSLPHTLTIYTLYLKYERREEQYAQYKQQIHKSVHKSHAVRPLVYSDTTPMKQPSKVNAVSLQSPAVREKSPNNMLSTTQNINGHTVTLSMTLHSPIHAVPTNDTQYINAANKPNTFVWRTNDRVKTLLLTIQDWCGTEYSDTHRTDWNKMCTVTNSALYALKLTTMSDKDWSESCRLKWKNIRETYCKNKYVATWLGLSRNDIESIFIVDRLYTRAIDNSNYKFCRCHIAQIFATGWDSNKQCIAEHSYRLLCIEILILLRVCNDTQYNCNHSIISNAEIIEYCAEQPHYNNNVLTQYGKYLKLHQPELLQT